METRSITRKDIVISILLVFAIANFFCVNSYSQEEDEPKLIDINTALKFQLESLPGIGPAYAQRIIDNRPYRGIQDLLEIKGIGPATLDEIKSLITVGEFIGPPPPQEDEIEDEDEDELININEAIQSKLESLPGIGPAYAIRIIAGRPYASIEDLLEVKGIGPATLQDLAPFITCVETELRVEPADEIEDEDEIINIIEDESESEPININEASQSELESLPGIGPTYAMRIVDNRPYTDLEDLLEVKGIGPATLEKIRSFVRVETELRVELKKKVITTWGALKTQ